MTIKSINNTFNIKNNKNISFKSTVYNNLASVTENVITAFQPVFIKKPKFPKDVFLKHFSDIEPKKRNYLYRFANLNEHYSLLYNIYDLQFLKEFSTDRLKSLFMIACEKDAAGVIRFTPRHLLQLTKLPQEKFDFIKPFARQKTCNSFFNFKTEDLFEMTKFSQQEMKKAMLLYEFNLPAKDLISLCKDSSVDININTLAKRLKTLQKIFKTDLLDISVKKYDKNYIVFLSTQNAHKNFKYVFDKNFGLTPGCPSNVDFETEKLKETNFFKRLNPFKKNKSQQSVFNTYESCFKVSNKEHFLILDKIQERANYLKQLYSKAYSYNFYVLNTGQGNYIEPNLKFPDNFLVNYWKQGAISQKDLIKICSENAGLIPRNDLKYFALHKIKITPYDTEKYLDIRYKNAMLNPVEIGSPYYRSVLNTVLKNEEETLKNIKAGKKMIVIDGLPGSGKSTIIHSILKKDENSFYTPDSDDIKAMFKEVYQNGEGADLVHRASSNILKHEILPRAFKQGKNLIYQTTGGSINVNNVILQAKNHGYEIDYIHISTPKDISVERSISRFEKTGRFLDPYVTLMIVNNNNHEKEFAAQIFSHNKNIKNAYVFENNKFYLVKDGNKCFCPKQSIV